MKETGKSIAKLAARRLSGELKKLTPEQELSVCGSLVSQAERERESVKRWMVQYSDGDFGAIAYKKTDPDWDKHINIVPVLITRTQARKRGK